MHMMYVRLREREWAGLEKGGAEAIYDIYIYILYVCMYVDIYIYTHTHTHTHT